MLGNWQYKVDGSGRITLQSRVFLRRIPPFINNAQTESSAKLDVERGVYTGSKEVTISPRTTEGAESHEPSPTSQIPCAVDGSRKSSRTHVKTKFFGHCSLRQGSHAQEAAPKILRPGTYVRSPRPRVYTRNPTPRILRPMSTPRSLHHMQINNYPHIHYMRIKPTIKECHWQRLPSYNF